jgi:hypothetical protein
VAAGLSVVALYGLGDLTVDADLRALRPLDHPVHEAEALLSDRFGVGLDTATVVVSGDDLPQTLERAWAAAELLRQHLGSEVTVTSPADYLGTAVDERLRQLKTLPFDRAATQLESELRAANLNPRAFAPGLEALRALGRGEDPGAPPPSAWPEWLSESVVSDQEGTWASLSLRLPRSSWPDGPPAELLTRLKAEIPGSAFASAAALGVELRTLAIGDLRTLGLLALVAVALTAVASFRGRLQDSLLAGLPVILGSLWTLGLWAVSGHSLDLFSLAFLPILLGIGIDDGLHVMHSARRHPAAGIHGAGIHGAVHHAGRALLLTTLTTCVGFGSLTLSRVPGLRSGGLLIAVGVGACLLATVMVLPALEAVATGRKR